MKEVVFDIEADNLLDRITKVWVIALQDLSLDDNEYYTDEFVPLGHSKLPSGTLEDGVKRLLEFDKIIAHNFMGYDYHVLEKYFPHLWNRKTVPFSRCWDTLSQSRAQLFDRPRIKGVKGNHGLAYYGELFKYPKPPIEDWSYWDMEKLNRCLVDIEINVRAYNYLNKEAIKVGLDFNKQIRRTQATTYWYTKQELYGTKGDEHFMWECVRELDKLTKDLADEIEPLLPKQLKVKSTKCTWKELSSKWDDFFRKVPKDRYDEDGKLIKPAYYPTTRILLKSGLYDKHTASHFEISQDPKESNNLVGGAYTKIYFEEPRMSQHAVIKDYLLSIGWKPTQYNYKKDSSGKFVRDERGKLITTTPKLTEDSFDSLDEGLGQKIAVYNTYMHRRRTFLNDGDDTKGWINNLREDGRISSGCQAFATSTSRGVQTGIVNCPSASAVYGGQMRKCWVADKGKVLISVDMDSAQLRILANYMGDHLYTDTVMNGTEYDGDKYSGTDVHTRNGIAFGVLPEEWVEEARVTQDKDLIKKITDIRKYSKNGIYAYLFGSGDEKLAQTLKLKTAAQGKAIKESFTSKLPAMGALQERLLDQYRENKYGRGGFIQVANDTWVYCTSEHKLLNYLLMGTEAQIQNEAICWANAMMERRNLQGNQVLAVHDELTFEFPKEQEAEGIALLSEMYGAASKRLGLEVLVTGTAQSGISWLDIH